MNDYWVAEAERIGDENAAYGDWVVNNKDYILEAYVDTEPEVPEEAYEGYPDDDREHAEDVYYAGLLLEDVPEDFINKMYINQGDEQ